MARTQTTSAVVNAATPFSVAAALSGYDDHRLEALLRCRPDLAKPVPPTTFGALAERATAARSAQIALLDVDRGAQQVAEALCVLPRPARASQLAARLGVDVAEVARPLARLVELALAFWEGDRIHLNPGLSIPHACRLGPPVADTLRHLTAADLARLCRALGANAGATKATTLESVGRVLSDEARVCALLDEGPAGAADLARRAARDGPVVSAPPGHYGMGEKTAVGWLVNRGLLVAYTWDSLIMPAEVGLALRGGRLLPDLALDPPSLRTEAVPADRVDEAGAEQALRIVGDVATVLDAWSTQPPKLLKDGGVGIRDVRRAAQAIDRSERDTARLIELAAASGLVTADSVSREALPLPAYDTWLEFETPVRWARLVAGWLDADTHASLAGVLDTRDKIIPPLLDRRHERNAVPRRRQMLDALAAAPSGHGAEPASVAARASWERPGVWGGGPAPATTLAAWVIEEAELLGVCSRGSLTTAGRLAVAGSVADAVTTLATRAPLSVSEIVVQADLTAVAAGALAPGVAAEMELLADVESRGAATVYRFSEASLRRGLDAGRSAVDILGFLREHSVRDVPQPLAYLVADLGRRFGTVRVGSSRSYVRSDDTALVAELVASRATRRLGLRCLAPTVAVSDADPKAVLDTIRRAGYLPAEEDASGGVVVTRPVARRASVGGGGAGSGDPHPHGRPDLVALARAVANGSVGDLTELKRALAGGVEPSAPTNGGVDPAAVIGALRRSSQPASRPPAKPMAATRPRPAAPAAAATTLWAPDGERPSHIARGRQAVRALLEQACDEEWTVRLSYTNSKGMETQLNAVVDDVRGRKVAVGCPPRWHTRTLVIDRIYWARVLTETEEDQLL